MLADLCLALIILGLTAYAVMGGADFGAGFWDLTAGGAHRGGRVRGMVARSMGPVWEANHVWLIFVLVIFWTCFPVAFGSTMSTLYVPLFIATIGIIFRGTAFALRGQAATINEARVLGTLFALSSVLVPFCMGAALGAVGSGRVPIGNAAGDPFASWLNPTSILVGALAVVTGAYLAAVFMAGDAARGGLRDLVRAFRGRALASGAMSGVLAIGGLIVLHDDARSLFDGLTSSPGLFFVIGSALAGALTMVLVWRESFEAARYSAAAAVGCVTVGWAFAQSPYLLPEELTLEQASAGDTTLVAVLVSVAVGMILLVPSLYLLYSFVLKGRLDEDFEPLDQRFRPLSANDHPKEGR
ncbi:MAG: cytochrome d ubiquinol oxidase subunit II [Actinobacteria bacterium]|nr:cytochrome d ubiquinol oxidase subunit II [Actinomycetota bacterium]